jgi:hypothetical protein
MDRGPLVHAGGGLQEIDVTPPTEGAASARSLAVILRKAATTGGARLAGSLPTGILAAHDGDRARNPEQLIDWKRRWRPCDGDDEAGPSALFARLSGLTETPPASTDPTLLHYLHKHSYEKRVASSKAASRRTRAAIAMATGEATGPLASTPEQRRMRPPRSR